MRISKHSPARKTCLAAFFGINLVLMLGGISGQAEIRIRANLPGINYSSLPSFVSQVPRLVCQKSNAATVRTLRAAGFSDQGPAQACPGGTGFRLLSSAHPATGVFVGYHERRIFDNVNYLRDLANLLQEEDPEMPLNIVVRPRFLGPLVQELEAIGLSHWALPINLIPVEVTTIMPRVRPLMPWLQDMFETGVQGSNPLPQNALFDLPYAMAENIATALAQSCEISYAGSPLVSTTGTGEIAESSNGNSGGNIEAFPGNVLVTGRNINPHLQTQLERQMGVPFNGASVQVNTDWLAVGHVDELFSTIALPGRTGPCDFALLYASPALGLELARQAQDQLGDVVIEPLRPLTACCSTELLCCDQPVTSEQCQRLIVFVPCEMRPTEPL